MIRLVIADDQPLIRLGLRILVETEPDLELAGEAEDGQAALALVRRVLPDVALLDIRMPRLDGLGVLKAIVGDAALARTRVVMVTTFALDEYLFEALRAGASGFVVKDTDPAELLQAIRVIAAGGVTALAHHDAPADQRLCRAACCACSRPERPDRPRARDNCARRPWPEQ